MATRYSGQVRGIPKCPTCDLPVTSWGYSNRPICVCDVPDGASNPKCACHILGTTCYACSRPKFMPWMKPQGQYAYQRNYERRAWHLPQKGA